MSVSPPTARLHHVVWCVRAESLPAVQRYWTEALGVPLAAFTVPEAGISVLMSWEAGVEVIAPALEAGSFTPAVVGFLEAKGEGVFSTVYEVDDLDAAVAVAVAGGATVTFEELIEPEELAKRLGWPPERATIRLRQTGLAERNGTTVCLQQSCPV